LPVYFGIITKFISQFLVLIENMVLCGKVISKAPLLQQAPFFQPRVDVLLPAAIVYCSLMQCKISTVDL